MAEAQLIIHNLVLNFFFVSEERFFTCEEIIGNNADTPSVDTLVILLLSDKFWSHIVCSSKCELHYFLFFGWRSKTEVGKLDVKIEQIDFRTHQIFKFDIAMDHILSVHVIKGE